MRIRVGRAGTFQDAVQVRDQGVIDHVLDEHGRTEQPAVTVAELEEREAGER